VIRLPTAVGNRITSRIAVRFGGRSSLQSAGFVIDKHGLRLSRTAGTAAWTGYPIVGPPTIVR